MLEKVIVIFRYLQDKDLFENFYKAHLSKRLLGGRSVSDEVRSCMRWRPLSYMRSGDSGNTLDYDFPHVCRIWQLSLPIDLFNLEGDPSRKPCCCLLLRLVCFVWMCESTLLRYHERDLTKNLIMRQKDKYQTITRLVWHFFWETKPEPGCR